MFLELFDFRSFLLFALIFFPIEYLLPIHEGRKLARNGWLTDVLHFFLSGIFIRVGLIAVIVVSVQVGTIAVPAGLRATIGALPVVVQVVVATVIADLGFYLAHRVMHAVPWLWNFHAVHHSSEQLDWLAAYRVHPVDQVLVKGASLVPMFVLGFSDVSIGIAAVIYQWQALISHSNVRVGLGPLKWLIATPEFHHWHHANQTEAHDKNFAGQLPLWDVLFGTAHMPGRMPTKYGVDEAMPHQYLQQLTYPFAMLTKAVSPTPRADEAVGVTMVAETEAEASSHRPPVTPPRLTRVAIRGSFDAGVFDQECCRHVCSLQRRHDRSRRSADRRSSGARGLLY